MKENEYEMNNTINSIFHRYQFYIHNKGQYFKMKL